MGARGHTAVRKGVEGDIVRERNEMGAASR
jgi:hypothetical protein